MFSVELLLQSKQLWIAQASNAASCKQLERQSSCTWPCSVGMCPGPSGRPPRYRSLLPYHTVALCAVRALYLLPLRLLCVERRGREQKRRTPLATIKNLRDCHDHQRWAEFDGGKRGAGQGKEGCLSARKTIVCTGIDATYVGLDSHWHAWHAVSRGCIETFLSGFVLPDCLY